MNHPKVPSGSAPRRWSGALCLGTDLGMGFPFEHGLQTTLIAMRLVDRLGLDPETASQTYYLSGSSPSSSRPIG